MQDIIYKARQYATEKHGKTGKLYNGKAYIVHPRKVAKLLKESGADVNLIAAGWLHDILEDTNTQYEELRATFGSDIADLVVEVTKNANKDFPNLKTERGLWLKEADRLANVSSCYENTDEKKRAKLFKKYSHCIIHEGTHLRTMVE